MEFLAKIRLHRKTASELTNSNPILLNGQKAIESDTGLEKTGDGVSAWNLLPYMKVRSEDVIGGVQDTITWISTNGSNVLTHISNLTDTVIGNENSSTKFPSIKGLYDWATELFATKDYADSLVVGLLDDRGSHNASSNLYPSNGGSGTAGVIMKGDLWFISVGGVLGGETVGVGTSIRALVDNPGQTSSNWSIITTTLGFTPENIVNKSTTLNTDKNSNIKYSTPKSIYDWATGLFGILNVSNIWTKSNVVSPVTLSSVSNIVSLDLSLSNEYSLLLTENTTISNPTNMTIGQHFAITLTQNASAAKTLAFDTYFKSIDGQGMSISTTLNAINVLFCRVNSANHITTSLIKHGVS